jgi:uncharacterized protein (TIGR02145 family)
MDKKKSKSLMTFVLNLNGRKTKIRYINSESFSNGEKLYAANNENEWKEASKGHIPAFFNAVSNSNGQNIKLYNWYAIINFHSISSSDFQIPTEDEFALIQKEFLHSFGKKHNVFEKLRNVLNGNKLFVFDSTGYVTNNGAYVAADQTAIIWTKTEYDKNNSYCYHFDFVEQKIRHLPYSKDYGFALIEIEKLTK